MDADDALIAQLDRELTYSIPNSYDPNEPPFIIKNMGMVRKNIVTIPSGRMDLIPEGYEIVDKRVLNRCDFPEFKLELREDQAEIYDILDDSSIINANPAWGKTFTGLAIAGKLGLKTLVVTHTVALRNQWVTQCKKVFGFEPDIIGSSKFGMSTPIVVANTQTLYRNIDKVKKEFGTIILDEMHHVSSPTFSRVIDTSHARYKIGLSATIERKDGKHVVFRDYFGNKVHVAPDNNSMAPTVHIYKSNVRFPDGGMPWAKRVNTLVNNEEYLHSVALIASTYAARGYKVLVVSDRVNFLNNCAKLVGDKAVCITGLIKDQEERDRLLYNVEYGDAEVLCGTQAIFAEGISCPPLSCLILGTPINNDPLLKQLCGRVTRIMEGKNNPVVIDIHLVGNTARRQASNRMGFYIKEGWEIKEL